jgi:hypothetical protein
LVDKPPTKSWQVRLPAAEDAMVDRLAEKHAASKNDVVRRGLRLLALVDEVINDGGKLLIRRQLREQEAETIEVWLI